MICKASYHLSPQSGLFRFPMWRTNLRFDIARVVWSGPIESRPTASAKSFIFLVNDWRLTFCVRKIWTTRIILPKMVSILTRSWFFWLGECHSFSFCLVGIDLSNMCNAQACQSPKYYAASGQRFLDATENFKKYGEMLNMKMIWWFKQEINFAHAAVCAEWWQFWSVYIWSGSDDIF